MANRIEMRNASETDDSIMECAGLKDDALAACLLRHRGN